MPKKKGRDRDKRKARKKRAERRQSSIDRLAALKHRRDELKAKFEAAELAHQEAVADWLGD